MGSLYTHFVSGLLFPLHERLKGHNTVAVHQKMEETQWWSRERLLDYQLDRLRHLLTQIQEHVPYYRTLFGKTGVAAKDIQTLDDLARLPFLTKKLISAHTEELKADNTDNLIRYNTGGSSGEPLIFFMGNDRVTHDVAAKWRATRWWGVDIGDPEIVVWGSPIELGAQDWVRVLRDRLLRTRLLPAFEMSPGELDQCIAKIQAFHPMMLFGYPSSLALIARHARKNNIRLDNIGIKVAFVTSERLYDEQRLEITSVYGCPVANGYGGRDAGFIAHECPDGGMHITAEDIIVEIVDREGSVLPPDRSGEIVVTHLATRDFPFIRYRTGDIGVLSEKTCSCGRGLPLLKDIKGRTTDFVVASDGTIMHGLALIYVIRDLPGIERFKIIQESIQSTRILIVPGDEFDQENISLIRLGILERLGKDVSLNIELVDDIPNEASGKFRYVVSKVNVF